MRSGGLPLTHVRFRSTSLYPYTGVPRTETEV